MTAVAWLSLDFDVNSPVLSPGGSPYYREYLPAQACGHPSVFGMPAWTSTTGFGVRGVDGRATFGFKVAVLHGMMGRALPFQIREAQKLGQVIVVDVDDHYDDLPDTNIAATTTDPGFSPTRNRDHFREAILCADVVTVATPTLLEHYARIHPNVCLIRNGVLPTQFQRRKVRDRKPVLGWVGVIPWRAHDIETLRAWLPDYLEDRDLMFHHSGHMETVPGLGRHIPSFAELSGVPAERITTSPRTSIADYSSAFQFDIGIVPLEDVPFNHAKSHLKGLEYAVSGVPFVAQDLPEYRNLWAAGLGRIAHSPADWVAQLDILMDPRERRWDDRRNYARVVADHSIMAREPEWKALMDDLT